MDIGRIHINISKEAQMEGKENISQDMNIDQLQRKDRKRKTQQVKEEIVSSLPRDAQMRHSSKRKSKETPANKSENHSHLRDDPDEEVIDTGNGGKLIIH